jgi:beta-galactosidase
MAWERWRSEGGGLYRHVWLLERAPLPIVSDGVHADPRLGEGGKGVSRPTSR